MKSYLSNALMFAAGAAVGSAVAWKLLKTKYEQLANEEIAKANDIYREVNGEVKDEEVPEEDGEEDEDISTYNSILEGNNYADNISREEAKKMKKPYVIPPEDYGDYIEYDTYNLTYYADGILADDMDEPMDMDDVDKAIGLGALDHFGEYEDDSVYVQNDETNSYYCILLDPRTYSDAMNGDPHQAEDE